MDEAGDAPAGCGDALEKVPTQLRLTDGYQHGRAKPIRDTFVTTQMRETGRLRRCLRAYAAMHLDTNIPEQTSKFNREPARPHDDDPISVFQTRKVHDFMPTLSSTTLSTVKPFPSKASQTL